RRPGSGMATAGPGQGTFWTRPGTWAHGSGTGGIAARPLGQRTVLRAANALGDFPVVWVLGRTHAPDPRRRFLHKLKNWGFAPQNGRVQRAVAHFPGLEGRL